MMMIFSSSVRLPLFGAWNMFLIAGLPMIVFSITISQYESPMVSLNTVWQNLSSLIYISQYKLLEYRYYTRSFYTQYQYQYCTFKDMKIMKNVYIARGNIYLSLAW